MVAWQGDDSVVFDSRSVVCCEVGFSLLELRFGSSFGVYFLRLCELDQSRLSLAIDQSGSLIIQNSLTDCFVDYIVSLRLNGFT